MKNLLKVSIVSAVIVMAACPLFAQPSGTYRLDRSRNEVYYEGRVVPDADFRSFEDLGFGYAKDRNHVYRFGQILEYVDPASFRVDRRFACGDGWSDQPDGGWRPEGPHHGGRHYSGYYKSSFDVYYDGRKIDANAGSFTILDDGYAKDSFDVFWQGRAIDGAVPSSFKSLGWGYARDAFNVYWQGRKIEGAASSSFKVGRNGYAEDAFNSYYQGRELDR